MKTKRFGDWLVDRSGMTHEPLHYSIEWRRLWDYRTVNDANVYCWPVHIHGKEMMRSDFMDAFEYALEQFNDRRPKGWPQIDWRETERIFNTSHQDRMLWDVCLGAESHDSEVALEKIQRADRYARRAQKNHRG